MVLILLLLIFLPVSSYIFWKNYPKGFERDLDSLTILANEQLLDFQILIENVFG